MNLPRLPLRTRSVRTRLTLWNVVVLALVMVAGGAMLRTTAERNLVASVDAELRHRSRRHVDFWTRIPSASHAPTAFTSRGKSPGAKAGVLPPADPSPADRWRVPVAERVFDLKGMQSYPSYRGEPPWDWKAFQRAAAGQGGYTEIRAAGVPLRVLSVPLRRASGQTAGVAQIAAGLEPMQHTLGNLDRALLTLLPAGLLAAWFGGMFLAGRVLRPVREVTHTAGRIGARDLAERLPVTGDDEFSELAATMNRMLARLEASFAQQQRFTADASHELRTPLTVVMSVASRLLSKNDLPADARRALERLDRAANVMEGIVRDLLLLARSDAGQMQIHPAPVPLSAVLEAALACVPQESGPSIRWDASEASPVVMGDESHLIRLFANVLNNAVQHTPPEGSVAVSVRDAGARVIVAIADTGAGIPAEHLPHVTERFYRVDTARSRAEGGTGLGLAICQTIAEAHGGSLKIDSVEGEGTTVTVDLPSAGIAGSDER